MKFEIIGRYDPIPWIIRDKKEVDMIGTGDWHSLDRFGVNVPNMKAKDGTPLPMNDLQEKVYNKSQEICEEIGKVDVALLMGDLTEGTRRTYDVPISTSDTDMQVEAAYRFYKDTIYKYCKPDWTIVVMGSKPHILVGMGSNLDYQTALRVSKSTDTIFGYANAQVYIGEESERYLWEMKHNMSAGRGSRLRPLEQDFKDRVADEIFSLNGSLENVPDVTVHAHRHVPQIPLGIMEGRRWVLVTPPLKALDIYAQTRKATYKTSMGFMKIKQLKRWKIDGEYLPIIVDDRKIRKL